MYSWIVNLHEIGEESLLLESSDEDSFEGLSDDGAELSKLADEDELIDSLEPWIAIYLIKVVSISFCSIKSYLIQPMD